MADPNELASIPLFSMLTDRERKALALNLDEMTFPPGQQLIAAGRSNHTLFVIRRGLVEVSVPGDAIVVLGAGSVLGEISIDRHVAATATVTTKTQVDAFVMGHDQYRVFEANEPLLLRLRTLMVERLLANR